MRQGTILLFAALSLSQLAAGSNLIVNGGFESGDFSAWALSSTHFNCVIDNTAADLGACDGGPGIAAAPAIYVNSGRYGTFLGNSDSFFEEMATMSQTVTLAPGSYQLTFMLKFHTTYPDLAAQFPDSFDGHPINTLSAAFGPSGSTPIPYYSLLNSTDFGFTPVSNNLGSLAGGTYTFSLTFFNEWGEFIVDDVCLNPTGQACTFDPPAPGEIPEPSTLLLAAPVLALGLRRARVR